jgi:hypothetical protein
MLSNKDKRCVSIATLTAITQVAYHVVNAVGGNEIELPDPRDVLEDVSSEIKRQLAETV